MCDDKSNFRILRKDGVNSSYCNFFKCQSLVVGGMQLESVHTPPVKSAAEDYKESL